MLGPLPTLYKIVVLAAVLVAFVALGLWASVRVPALPTFGLAGAGIGAGAGVLVAFALLRSGGSGGPSQPPRRQRQP